MPTKGSSAVPCILYENAPVAIEWLNQAFGFEPKLIIPGDGGNVEHAELVLGDIMVMLGSPNDRPFGRNMIPPNKAGNKVTQGPYLFVADPDTIYKRAVSAGAEILVPIHDESFGGRHFACRDLEGHIWSLAATIPGMRLPNRCDRAWHDRWRPAW
jgi:uncharacterized glyoxalase superfamily protein PhnB